MADEELPPPPALVSKASDAEKAFEHRIEHHNEVERDEWYALEAQAAVKDVESAIKEQQRDYFNRLGAISSKEVAMAIKATHPVTHKTIVPGVSRYPVQESRLKGDLTLAGAGWMVLSYIAYKRDRQAMNCLQHCFQHIFDPGFRPTEDWLRANEPSEVRG